MATGLYMFRKDIMTLELTKEEATALVQLIDIAVKSAGLNVAQAALHLTNKITEAGKPEETTDGI